jgi:hypothetical protein
MKSAWRLYRNFQGLKNWSQCLTIAWEIEHELLAEQRKLLNVIIQRLQLVSIKGTRNWYTLLTANKRKKQSIESQELLDEGLIPFNDCIVKQRRISRQSSLFSRYVKKIPRKRIVPLSTIKVDINLEIQKQDGTI